jgi:hypothetical protein
MPLLILFCVKFYSLYGISGRLGMTSFLSENLDPYAGTQSAAAHMNIHTQAILPLASTISAGAPAQQSTTDPQDMQLSTAGAAEHEVPPAPSAHTLQPTSTPPHSGRSRDPSSATQGTPLPTQQVPRTNRYTVTVSGLLQGHRCYVDASTAPDQPN